MLIGTGKVGKTLIHFYCILYIAIRYRGVITSNNRFAVKMFAFIDVIDRTITSNEFSCLLYRTTSMDRVFISSRYYSASLQPGNLSNWNCFSIFSGSGVAKALVSNLPAQARLEELDILFSNYGQVQNIEKLSSRDPNTQTFLVSYETQEQAQQ